MIMLILTGLFYLILFSIGAGLLISILIFVPLTIYVIPYAFWLGIEHTKGKHEDKKKEKLSKSVKHATILYGSWISRKEPSF